MYVEIIHCLYAGNRYSRAIIFIVHPKHRCHNQSRIRPYPSLLCVHVSSMYSSISLILCLPLELTYPLIPSLASTQLTHWQPGSHTHMYNVRCFYICISLSSIRSCIFSHLEYSLLCPLPFFVFLILITTQSPPGHCFWSTHFHAVLYMWMCITDACTLYVYTCYTRTCI